MQTSSIAYGYTQKLENVSFDEACTRVKEALKKEGFGVLSEIDVQKAMREKLGVDVAPQVILGACNPQLAHQGLQAEPNLGLLLPCNVTVRMEEGQAVVGVVDAAKMMEVVGNPNLGPVAREAQERLGRMLSSLK